jgi:hypothetical protein
MPCRSTTITCASGSWSAWTRARDYPKLHGPPSRVGRDARRAADPGVGPVPHRPVSRPRVPCAVPPLSPGAAGRPHPRKLDTGVAERGLTRLRDGGNAGTPTRIPHSESKHVLSTLGLDGRRCKRGRPYVRGQAPQNDEGVEQGCLDRGRRIRISSVPSASSETRTSIGSPRSGGNRHVLPLCKNGVKSEVLHLRSHGSAVPPPARPFLRRPNSLLRCARRSCLT